MVDILTESLRNKRKMTEFSDFCNTSLDHDSTCQNMGGALSFHPFHGENICLMDNEMVACRSKSFAHAISFSKYPLKPMEIFLIEIEKCERGWSGNLRVGLTQHDPNKKFHLPQFSIPDLQQLGKSWIFSLPSYNGSGDIMPEDGTRRAAYSKSGDSILGDGEYVYLYRGFLKKSLLRPSPWYWKAYDEHDEDVMSVRDGSEILPTDVGSRIGLIYLVKNNKAEMHFIINGQDQGPCAKDIPCSDGPLYVVVDVYGTTKQVRIIPVGGVMSLQYACRDIILRRVKRENIYRLPVPTKIKEFLCFELS